MRGRSCDNALGQRVQQITASHASAPSAMANTMARGGSNRASRAGDIAAMPEQYEQRAGVDTALERTIFLSDGVFAIATTLLVLAIGVPAGKTAKELPGALIGLWPSIATYALSFIVVGAYWMAHQRIFHYITRSDSGL